MEVAIFILVSLVMVAVASVPVYGDELLDFLSKLGTHKYSDKCPCDLCYTERLARDPFLLEADGEVNRFLSGEVPATPVDKLLLSKPPVLETERTKAYNQFFKELVLFGRPLEIEVRDIDGEHYVCFSETSPLIALKEHYKDRFKRFLNPADLTFHYYCRASWLMELAGKPFATSIPSAGMPRRA